MSASEPDAPKAPLKTRIAASFLLVIIRILGRSYRIRISGERGVLLNLLERDSPVILTLWHNRVFYFATYFDRYLLRRGFRLAQMSSHSKDGEIGALVGKLAGAAVVRGSSSNRGAAGLRGLYRAMVIDRQSTIILPDGSKGPVYKAKSGVVMLAKMTGSSIIPLSFWASRYWRIGSWDRMIIPKPFARIQLTVGAPIRISRDSPEEETETCRLEVESALDRLGREAEAAFANGAAW